MTKFLCHECRTDLTPRFLEDFEEAMKTIHPQMIAMKEALEASGASDVVLNIGSPGADVWCPKCGTKNEVRLDSMDQLEEMVMEVNR